MRERTSLNSNWRFALGHAADPSRDFEFARDRSLVKSGEARGAAGVKFDDSQWRIVDLPHDWAIELPTENIDEREFCEHGFRAIGPGHPQNSVGWYRRVFSLFQYSGRGPGRGKQESEPGSRYWLEFDGAFREAIVWLNGHRLGRHENGYTPFRYDITDQLNYDGENSIAVRVDATGYEGWWYEGAGINRHVWLLKTSPLHIAHDGVIVRSEVKGNRAVVTVRTTVVNDSDDAVDAQLVSEVFEKPKKSTRLRLSSKKRIAPWSTVEVVQKFTVAKPKLWSPDAPQLYALTSSVMGVESRRTPGDGRHNNEDTLNTTFGIRTIKWDAKRGFILNGQPIKIKGTCNHHQHAGVGTAVPDELQRWRLRKLKELGSNAYRCSHYMVPTETLDECDRLGLLVMAESRLADTSPQFLEDFKTMIRRDRNHPSIILWSIGNEEHTVQWSIAGERIGKTLRRVAHQLDPTRGVTCAMHDRGLGEGFANVVDVHGWNYIAVGDIEKYHQLKPNQPIVSSEEGSTVCTRGEYADDKERGYVSAYGLRAPKWGSLAEKWWPFVAERPWIAGGFVWTGFDYYGEPIPYKWPCTASHFGLMDLCGFPKDLYWYFKAWWGEEPVLHLLPHWNWTAGQTIDVWAFSNHDEVELFLNDESRGRQTVPRNGHVEWKVDFAPGELLAVGYRKGKRAQTTTVWTPSDATKLSLTTDRLRLRGINDVVCVSVGAHDDQNRIHPNANQLVNFTLTGPGKIIGVGNGDPSSHAPDHSSQRRLFHGLAQVIVQSTGAGAIELSATAENLIPAKITLRVAR